MPFPSPGDLPNPGTESMSPALQANSLPLSHQGSPYFSHTGTQLSPKLIKLKIPLLTHPEVDEFHSLHLCKSMGFPLASVDKESACNAGDLGVWVWSLGWEDPLEKEMALFLPKESHGQGTWQVTVQWVLKTQTTKRTSITPILKGPASFTAFYSSPNYSNLWWSFLPPTSSALTVLTWKNLVFLNCCLL